MKRRLLPLAVTLLLSSPFLPAMEDGVASDRGRVVVKFVDLAKVRLRAQGFVSLTGADLTGLEYALASLGRPRIERLFARDERDIDRDLDEARRGSGLPLADLNGY